MKRILSSLFLLTFFFGGISAQITQDGYYRVMNYGVYSKQSKQKSYCCITYKECKVNMSNGTSQKFEPIALWSKEETGFSDPAAVIYITNPSSATNCNLQAQGVNVRNMFNGALQLTGTQNNYTLRATVEGQSAYLYSTDKPSISIGDNAHLILTTSGSDAAYRYWSIYPVNSDNDKYYFGVKPTLEANGKYYAPYYVSFPFKPKSPGMKVYYVSYSNDKCYELKEITGVVPAATPVLIECSSPNSSDNRLDLLPPGTKGTSVSGNKLSGVYFFNKYINTDTYPDAITAFDATAMRVWNVKDGKLVLSTDTETLSTNKDLYPRKPEKWVCGLNANQSYLPVSASASETLVSADDLKATIHFDADGGSAVASLSGISGMAVTAPAPPEKEGYTFAGWEPTLPAVFPEADITVKAKWQINQYSVKFVSDGKTMDERKQDYGTAITQATAPSKEGYTFLGWDNSDVKTVPSHDVVFTAQWQINQYSVKFVSDGKTMDERKQDYGTAITLVTAPSKEGYTFLGWDNADVKTVPSHDVVFTAKWQINQYSVKFVSDGKTMDERKQDYGTAITLATAPSKEGYTFLGWDNSDVKTVPSHDVVFTAQWQINQYSVKFVSDGNAIDERKQDYGTAITLATAPTKDGYTFLGWDNADVKTVPSHDVTFTAQWQINQWTVKFVSEGVILQEEFLTYGTTIKKPAIDPVKVGAAFIGWTPAYTAGATVPDHDVTYTAVFNTNSYTVTFDTDGGTAIAPIQGVYDSEFMAPANPTKEGYTFAGWTPAMPTRIPAGDLTLTAQWTPNKYMVSFVSDGTAIQEKALDYATAIHFPDAPSKEGYTFLGWDNAEVTVVPSHDVVFTAQWQINQYVLTLRNEHSPSGIETFTYDYGTPLDVEAPQDLYYTFLGWDAAVPATMPACDLTLTAQWALSSKARQIELQEGWNWVAFGPASESGFVSVLATGAWDDGDEIKDGNALAAYSTAGTAWIGPLASAGLSSTGMYKLHSSAMQTLTLPETLVMLPSETPLTVKQGWNYIHFLPLCEIPLTEALADYEANDGDMIKSQTEFATYSATEDTWKGTLSWLSPGKGYMLKRNSETSATFCFPDKSETNEEHVPAPAPTRAKAAYADNMTLVALVDGIEAESGDEVIAMADGEVRGIGHVAEDGRVYLNVMGCSRQDITLTLARNGEVVARAKSALVFESDAVIGTYDEPAAIRFATDDSRSVSVLGNVTAIYTVGGMKLGTNDVSSLPAGAYIVYGENNGQTIVTTVTKK